MKINRRASYFGVKFSGAFMVNMLFTAILVIIYLSNTTYFKVISDQGVESIKAEIVTNLVVNCVSEEYIDIALFTNDQLASCYPVDENERNLYPFSATLVWQEHNNMQTKTIQSPNAFDAYSESIEFPVLLENEGNTYLGTLTIAYEIL